jgi:hypothetical protein
MCEVNGLVVGRHTSASRRRGATPDIRSGSDPRTSRPEHEQDATFDRYHGPSQIYPKSVLDAFKSSDVINLPKARSVARFNAISWIARHTTFLTSGSAQSEQRAPLCDRASFRKCRAASGSPGSWTGRLISTCSARPPFVTLLALFGHKHAIL